MYQDEVVNPAMLMCKEIDELNFDVKIYNELKRHSINRIYELCRMSEHDVLKIRNIGRSAVDEIRFKLNEIGLDLKKRIKNDRDI